jgi:hypothetical protein
VAKTRSEAASSETASTYRHSPGTAAIATARWRPPERRAERSTSTCRSRAARLHAAARLLGCRLPIPPAPPPGRRSLLQTSPARKSRCGSWAEAALRCRRYPAEPRLPRHARTSQATRGDGRLLHSAGVISAGAAHRDNHRLQKVYRDSVGLLPRFTVTVLVYDRGLPRNYRFTSEMPLTLPHGCATVPGVADGGKSGKLSRWAGEHG